MPVKIFSIKRMLIAWLFLTFAGPVWIVLTGQVDLKAEYSTANRDSAKLAPDPHTAPEAVIQVYAARAFNWRGIFATHCWIAVKPENAAEYTVYQIMGWRTYRGLPALVVMQDAPDRNWYNAVPHLVLDVRGKKASTLIPKVDEAIKAYPYADPYVLWPGPNSNTFPAYVGRRVPELGLTMPSSAIGKDYVPISDFLSPAPSGTGYQLSFFGALGIMAAKKEGIEINILGLVYGIRFSPFRILLPGFN